MKKLFKIYVSAAIVIAIASLFALAQQVKRTPFDVTHYVIDAALTPAGNRLDATADVTFVPLEDTRSITFELNGSLKVDAIIRVGSPASGTAAPAAAVGQRGRTPAPRSTTAPAAGAAGASSMTGAGPITFVQDQTGVSDLGPSVRIDLGENVTKGTPVTLRFKYSGVLNSPNGGPLITKRLAYIGDQRGYLMYAARWFPFHNYAADMATADITLSAPGGMQIVGHSDVPVTNAGGKQRFVITKPALIGNFAYGRFVSKNLSIGGHDLQFYVQPGMENQTARYGETLGKALAYYTKRWGAPEAGNKLIVVQTDDDTLDFYSARGMLFVANRHFEEARDITLERLQREAAYQWWGQTIGLRSFDDAWLSQGLAEYSAFSLREQNLDGAKLEALRRELLEKSLTFEQTASLLRAPSNLDDTSTAYQYIMYAKGALVFKLLRDTLGEQKFDQLLRSFLQQYRGKNASIDDFEKLTSQVAGQPMRYFFARWVESTGVPEFAADYQIIRTRGGKFIARGTVKQNYDNLRLPIDVQLRSEGEQGLKTVTVQMDESSADFNIESTGKPLGVIIDPGYKLLRISPDLRVSSIARRGIEQFKEGNYVDAQQQFEAALKLDRSNAWVYYHLGLLFLEQRNYDLAIENFKATRDLGAQGSARPAWLHVWSEIKMGNAYDAKGDRTRATAAYGRAAALGDNYDNAQEAVKKYQATPYDPRERQTTASR